MKEKLPQKIGSLLGTVAFFFTLFIGLSYGVILFDAWLYAVYSFLALLILGWAVGIALVYRKEEEKQFDIGVLEPNQNEMNTSRRQEDKSKIYNEFTTRRQEDKSSIYNELATDVAASEDTRNAGSTESD